MKKFNLELAKSGYEVATRDGRNVRIISFDKKSSNGEFTIVGLVDCGNYEAVYLYTKDGVFEGATTNDAPSNLVMKPIKMEGWINIYKCFTTGINIYPTKESAILNKDEESDYVQTIKIEWEE